MKQNLRYSFSKRIKERNDKIGKKIECNNSVKNSLYSPIRSGKNSEVTQL